MFRARPSLMLDAGAGGAPSRLTEEVASSMGVVISLDERRRAHSAKRTAPRAVARAELFFDLGDPFSYLAAERVERAFDAVTWVPALAPAALREPDDVLRARAEARAGALRMPLVWPERHPAPALGAMRVASCAAESGRAAAFVLAAGRLAFCGGFDLDDPEILAEAAAAAGVALEDCLQAAGDRGRDAAIAAAGRELLESGADRLPALRVGGQLFIGEERIVEAAAAARWGAAGEVADV